MAKSFIDQLFDLVGLKTPSPHGQYSPSAYREEPSKKSGPEAAQAATQITGVARYLAAKYPEKQKGAETDISETAKLTGVAKYLAKKQQEEQEKAAAEAAALTNMTGVARYLARLEENITANPEPAKTETTAVHADPVTLTGVDKYLAKQQNASSDLPQPEAVQKAAKAKATEQKPVVKEQKPVVEEKKAQPEQATEKQSPPAAKKPDKIINLAEAASQCQSTTSKGTQCRRKTNLETLEKTINDQKYKFVACSQHHSEEFIPFAELLQEG
jgi:hypothetical protein